MLLFKDEFKKVSNESKKEIPEFLHKFWAELKDMGFQGKFQYDAEANWYTIRNPDFILSLSLHGKVLNIQNIYIEEKKGGLGSTIVGLLKNYARDAGYTKIVAVNVAPKSVSFWGKRMRFNDTANPRNKEFDLY